MKKLLLSLACAASATVAFAQDEVTTSAETITTDDETGIVTIVDDFVAGSSRITKSAVGAVKPTAPWSMADDAAVQYVGFRSQWAASGNYFQLLVAEGAYIQFTLPDYDCQKVTIPGYTTSSNSGKFYCYAGDGETPFHTIDITDANRKGDLVIEIPEEIRAAGTAYKIVSAYVAANAETGAEASYSCRLQFSSMEFTCTKVEQEVEKKQWAAPVCNIPDGSYVLAGQKIKFTCEEGGTINGTYNYLELAEAEKLVDGEFTVPSDITANRTQIKVIASVNGRGKDKSEVVTMVFTYTNGINLYIVSQEYTGMVESKTAPDATFGYKLRVLNFGNTTTAVTVKAIVTDDEGTEVASNEKVIKPEAAAAAQADAEGEEAADEVTPVFPVELVGDITVSNLPVGRYTVKLQSKIGTNAETAFTDMTLGEGLTDEDLDFEIPSSPTTEIEEIVTGEEDAAPLYYDLTGHRATLRKDGRVLIEVRGNKVRKMIDC